MRATGKRIFQTYRPGLRSVCASAQQLRESYHEKGYAVIRNAICPSLVAETQEHVEWLMDRYPGVPPEKLQHPLSFVDPFWLRLVSEPQLVDLAETYLGTGDIALFVSHYVCKMPGSGQQVKWHQDASYFDVESSTPGALAEPLNLWLAVDRATQHNGCLQVIPGSHKRGSMEVQSTDSRDVLGSTVAQDVDESTAEFIELEPGQCLPLCWARRHLISMLHCRRCVHPSSPTAARLSQEYVRSPPLWSQYSVH